MNYAEFIRAKQHSTMDYAIRKGRCAVFLDTGLGKTLIQLETARQYVMATNKPSLIITPLAVAFQFVRESEKFGIDGVKYSKDGVHNSDIVICNYERLDKFNPDDFGCVLLDESSILKNFNGAIKQQVTSFLKRVDYRFLFTATPSPNDFIELGTSSEALGYMGYMDMLSKFFSNNEDTISPQKIGCKWNLKPHAERAFFDWVKSWSISMRKPSDFSFSDERHTLPALNVNNNIVKNDSLLCISNQFEMFAKPSSRLTEVRDEQKQTITNRCERAVELASNYETSVYWCNFNDEGDLLAELDKDSVQIKGSMKLEQKEDILLAFANGEVKRLITKPKITCFGLNWQHCNHTVYFPTFSYEQYYQAIRRFYRFGQQREVTVDLVYSEGQEKVIQSLLAKTEKADELFTKLNNAANGYRVDNQRQFNQDIIKPSFL
jgi:Helicase conserved C-terminal domain